MRDSGIVHMLRNGGRWQDCPTCYGSVDDDLNSVTSLVGPRHFDGNAGGADGGDAGARLQLIDSTTAKAHRSAAGGKGGLTQAIGRSRGGRGTKIHLVVDGAGRILAFTVTPGQMGDLRPAHGLLANLPPPAFCAADTAYDSNGLRHFLLGRGATPVIPNNPTRRNPQPFDARAYKARNIIERTIERLKDWRRIHTRYDKLAANFASAVAMPALLICWC